MTATPSNRLGSPVAYFKTAAGKVYSLGLTSQQFTLGGDGWTWATVARQGRKALAYPDAPKLKTLSFTHALSPMPGLNVTGTVQALRSLAASTELVQLVNVSHHERGYWRITDLTVTVTQRTPQQDIEIASLAWALEEAAPDVLPAIGHSVNPPGLGTSAGSTEDSYTVKAGDTIYTLAAKLLGDAAKWTQLASFNLLPDGIVQPGQVLHIPRASTGIARPQ